MSSLQTKTANRRRLWTLADGMKRHVRVADRKWRLRTYAQCFVASEAVDWLLAHMGAGSSRRDAVAAAQEMVAAGLLRHVAGRTAFADGQLFFVFCGVPVVERLGPAEARRVCAFLHGGEVDSISVPLHPPAQAHPPAAAKPHDAYAGPVPDPLGTPRPAARSCSRATARQRPGAEPGRAVVVLLDSCARMEQ